MVEIIVATLIFTLLMATLFNIFRTGTKQATKGIHHADTIQEGRRILRQVCLDIKSGCVDTYILSKAIEQGAKLPMAPSRFFKSDEKSELASYSFLVFPLHKGVDEIVKEQGIYSLSQASWVSFYLEKVPENEPLKRLIRVESPTGSKKVISEKVSFFKIDLLPPEPSLKKYSHRLDFFRITLQLLDNFGNVDLSKGLFDSRGRMTDESLKSKIVVADFFDVAYPEEWNRVFQNSLMNKNWNSFVVEPEAGSQ